MRPLPPQNEIIELLVSLPASGNEMKPLPPPLPLQNKNHRAAVRPVRKCQE